MKLTLISTESAVQVRRYLCSPLQSVKCGRLYDAQNSFLLVRSCRLGRHVQTLAW